MMFDAEEARKEGYSDEEIARYLSSTRQFDLDSAVGSGVSYGEFIDRIAKVGKKVGSAIVKGGEKAVGLVEAAPPMSGEIPVEPGFNPYAGRKEFGLAEKRPKRLVTPEQKVAPMSSEEAFFEPTERGAPTLESHDPTIVEGKVVQKGIGGFSNFTRAVSTAYNRGLASGAKVIDRIANTVVGQLKSKFPNIPLEQGNQLYGAIVSNLNSEDLKSDKTIAKKLGDIVGGAMAGVTKFIPVASAVTAGGVPAIGATAVAGGLLALMEAFGEGADPIEQLMAGGKGAAAGQVLHVAGGMPTIPGMVTAAGGAAVMNAPEVISGRIAPEQAAQDVAEMALLRFVPTPGLLGKVAEIAPKAARAARARIIDPTLEVPAKVSTLTSETGSIRIPTGKMVKEVWERGRETREGLSQKVFNRFQSIENLTERAKKLGANIPEGLDAGKRAREYLGIGPKVKTQLEHRTFRITEDGRVEFTGEGLKPILDDYEKTAKALKPAEKVKVLEKDFNDYLISKRTVEDLQRPKSEWTDEFIVTPEQVKNAETTLENLKSKYGSLDHFEPNAQRLYDYQKRTLHQLVESGVMSEERFNQIVAQNPHYVPFDRILETVELEGGTPKARQPFTEARSPIKKIKGSEKEIHDPIESMIKNTYRIMDVAERNTVARSVARLKDIPELGMGEVKAPVVPKGKVKVEGEEYQAWGKSPFKPKGNIVEYYENGQKKYLDVPKNLYEAMSGLNETSSDLLTKLLALPARTLRTGATITPEFMFRNPLRDQWTAMIQTKFGFRPFVDSAGAVADILGKSDVYHEWLASGGAYSTFTELSRKNLTKMVKDLRGEKSVLRKLNIISHAQDVSQLMEQATRLGVYKAARRKGLSPVEAGFESRESTVDFARRGSSTSLARMSQWTAFMNAGIQGFDKSVRTFRENPGSATVKAMATITIPSLVLYMRWKDDPDYKELPRWQKDLFWMVHKNEDGSFVKVPKPFVYGQVFGSTPERFMEYLHTKDPAAFSKLEKSLIDAALPVQGDPSGGVLPTAVKPLIENVTNWSFFRERPVVGKKEEGMLPFKQYGKYTSETAKELGKRLGYSPQKIENLAQGYFGGTGRYALDASDYAASKIGILPPGLQRPKELADYPLAKGFVTRPSVSQPESLEQFYENADELSRAYKSYQDSLRNIGTDEAKYILERYPKLFLSPGMEGFKKNIGAIGKQIDLLIRSKIPEQEKRRLIREAETLRMKLSQQANVIMRGIKAPVKPPPKAKIDLSVFEE